MIKYSHPQGISVSNNPSRMRDFRVSRGAIWLQRAVVIPKFLEIEVSDPHRAEGVVRHRSQNAVRGAVAHS